MKEIHKIKPTTFILNDELKKKIEVLAERQGNSQSSVIRTALHEFFARKENGN